MFSSRRFASRKRPGFHAAGARARPVKDALRDRRRTVGQHVGGGASHHIGATTLAEVLPTSMGATTLDAVAEIVAPARSGRRAGPRSKPGAECPAGKIRNPASGRCVNIAGRIGKTLV